MRGLAPYVFFGKMAGWHRIVFSILVIYVWAAVRYGSQGLLEVWSESDGAHWQDYLGGYAAFCVLSVLLCWWTIYFFLIGTVGPAALNIHATEIRALFAAAPSYFMVTPAGRIINRLSQDILAVDFLLPTATLNFLVEGSWIIGILVLTFLSAPWLTLSIIVLAPMYFYLVKFYLRTSKQLQSLEAASKSPMYSLFGATLVGLDTIRAFGAQKWFQGQSDKQLNASQGAFYYRYAGVRFLRTGLTVMTFIVAVGLAILAVALAKTTSAGFLGLALSNMSSLAQILSDVLSAYANMENSVVSIQRINEVVSIPPEEGSTPYRHEKLPSSPEKDGGRQACWLQHGSIVFENFSLRYGEDTPAVLNDVSFRVQPGQRVGICGRTGSGKSTLGLSLLRVVPSSLTAGRILVDGVDISSLPVEDVRKALTLVVQDPFLWYASIRDNLDPESTSNDSDIWNALEAVEMRDAIAELPEKLDTVLEDSSALSRGQRQLLCLARALLRSRQIVILDEASSSVDASTDAKIQQVVQERLRTKTVLAVAHRISTILDFDLILVLDAGRLVESGPPGVLLADPASLFYGLAASQGLVGPARLTSGSATTLHHEEEAV